MPETKDHRRLLLRFRSGTVLRSLVLLLALAATVAGGQESGLKPAMLSYDQSPAWMSAVAGFDSLLSPLDSVSALRIENPAAGMKSDRLNITVFLDTPLGNQNDGYGRNWRQLIHKKSAGAGWAGFWEHIEAGYGQFCRLESCFGKSTMELGQPRCAYLKARFSF